MEAAVSGQGPASLQRILTGGPGASGSTTVSNLCQISARPKIEDAPAFATRTTTTRATKSRKKRLCAPLGPTRHAHALAHPLQRIKEPRNHSKPSFGPHQRTMSITAIRVISTRLRAVSHPSRAPQMHQRAIKNAVKKGTGKGIKQTWRVPNFHALFPFPIARTPRVTHVSSSPTSSCPCPPFRRRCPPCTDGTPSH